MSTALGPAVLVTREEPGATALAGALRARGLLPVILPTVKTVPVTETAGLDRALSGLRDFDWIVFSSATAVRMLLARMGQLGVPASDLRGAAILAGPSTAAVLQSQGIVPLIVGPKFSAESALQSLMEKGIRGKRVLLPAAGNGRRELAEGLRAGGAEVHVIELYQTVSDVSHGGEILGLLASGSLRAITLASPSAASGLIEALVCAGAPDPVAVTLEAPIICLGETTARAARDLGMSVAAVARETNIESLAQTVSLALETVEVGR